MMFVPDGKLWRRSFWLMDSSWASVRLLNRGTSRRIRGSGTAGMSVLLRGPKDRRTDRTARRSRHGIIGTPEGTCQAMDKKRTAGLMAFTALLAAAVAVGAAYSAGARRPALPERGTVAR